MTDPSRQRLLESIQPGMKLNRAFFMKIYGYDITTPGFATGALERLKKAGCSKAEEYYNRFVSEYEQQYKQAMKEAAAWYCNQRKDDEKVNNNDSGEVAGWGLSSTHRNSLSQKQSGNLNQRLDRLKALV